MKNLPEIADLLRTTAQLKQDGIGRARISYLKNEHRIRALRRGVYIGIQQYEDLEPWERYIAETIALAIVSPQTVFSHQTAALLHGLWLWGAPPSKLHVWAPLSSRGTARMVVRHPFLQPNTPVITLPLGLRVTEIEQTVVDCSRIMPEIPAVAVADSVLYLKKSSPLALKDRLNSYGGHQKSNVWKVATLMSSHAESPGETGTRLLLQEMNLDFKEQYEVWLNGRCYRADFYIPSLGLIIEFDGNMKYTQFGAFQDVEAMERYREKELQNAGYVVFRTTWRRVFHEPAVFKHELGGLIEQLRRRRP